MNKIGSRLVSTLISLTVFLSFSKYAEAFDLVSGKVTTPCVSYSEIEKNIIGLVSAGRTKAPNSPPVLTDKFVFFHLLLEAPICIDAGTGVDGLEPAHEKIEHVELGITTAEEYRLIHQLVGRRIKCTGKFAPSITGFHWDDVILWNAVCSIIPREGDLVRK
ncbi:hypothetical protein ELE36_06790 [Pseudolysobacter antarcticus]|uniref:DUF4431 domain-containing protein n=1 Tax=Pseudolysobacter antarcticus TaxID=2511995 RepID=A0A411HI55_9GAMM|nr:hypothetical protein [Pseudolysobacter antarcticus]QBB70094.1 hypothetical protein ELE36_06790 [Pseudolysobacter antarcticus]